MTLELQRQLAGEHQRIMDLYASLRVSIDQANELAPGAALWAELVQSARTVRQLADRMLVYFDIEQTAAVESLDAQLACLPSDGSLRALVALEERHAHDWSTQQLEAHAEARIAALHAAWTSAPQSMAINILPAFEGPDSPTYGELVTQQHNLWELWTLALARSKGALPRPRAGVRYVAAPENP